MLAEHVGQPTHGWKSGLLHISCTVEKCCHRLNTVEERRERKSGKLREDCCSVLKTVSTKFFLNSILVQFCSDWFHYQSSTLRSIKYCSVFIPYEVLKLLIKYSTQYIKILLLYSMIHKKMSVKPQNRICATLPIKSAAIINLLLFGICFQICFKEILKQIFFFPSSLSNAYVPLQFMQRCQNTADTNINNNIEQQDNNLRNNQYWPDSCHQKSLPKRL